MAEDTTPEESDPPKKKGKLGLILGLVLALVGGGGAFFAVYTGIILAPNDASADEIVAQDETVPLPPISFVPLEPITINVGQGGKDRLRFRAELEVVPARTADVELLTPRILDVLNGYLRAIEVKELRDPAALIVIRAQMLRRIQIVTGDGHVRDLLITEFVFI